MSCSPRKRGRHDYAGRMELRWRHRGDRLQYLSLVTQHSDVRHRIITTIGQQDNDVDQHSHTADLLAAVSRAVRRGKGACETEAVNFDTRRVLQGEGDEQSQYQEATAAPGNSGGVQVGWGAPSAAAWDAHRLWPSTAPAWSLRS